MLRVSLRGLSSHKFRVVLTAISVALGVALMAGTYILTDTINASYTKLVGAAYSGESVVITPSAPLGDNNSAQISPVSAAMLDKVRHVPGVAEADGQIITSATLLDARGKALGDGRLHLCGRDGTRPLPGPRGHPWPSSHRAR